MKINKKSHVSDDSSLFSRLPDEMILQVLSKIIDFKTLCLCELVSKRFWRIVHQVDTVSFTSFTDPFADPPSEEVIPSDTLPSLGSYWSAIICLKKFRRVKSLRIQVPSSFVNNHLLFKWKIKFEEEEEEDSSRKKRDIAFQGVRDVVLKLWLLMDRITNLPLLQDVSITDPGEMGRVSLNGEKVAEMRNLSEAGQRFQTSVPLRISQCYVPLLKLPVSGYVMKGVTLILLGRNDLLDNDVDSFMKIDLNDFEDKEEAAYSEAVMEIFKKHRCRIKRLT